MEIMQQSATNHLDSRWRPHLLPYSGSHALSSLPNLHDHIRQQMISQQQSPDHVQHSTTNEHLQQQQIHHHHHHHHQQQQLPQQLSHRQDLQLQQQHRQIIVQHQQRRDSAHQQPPPSSKEQQQSPPPLANSRGGGNGLPSSPLQLNSLSLQSSPSSASPSTPPTPSPPAPSPGKSGGKDGEEKKGEEWEQYNAGAAFLGPTLWDKTLSYDSDLKVSLEYMDLDEFLNENGIPIEGSKRNGNATVGNGGGNSSVGLPNNNSNSNSSSTNSVNSIRQSAQSPEAPSSPENSPPQMGSGMGACPQVSSSMANAPVPVTASGPISVVPPPALSPQDYIGDCSSSVSSPGSPDPHSPLQVHEPDSTRASQGRDFVAGRLNDKLLGNIFGATSLSTAAGNLKNEVQLNYVISPNDLALATVPGQDFDPRTRCFSEEELKPQPMIKKSRKQFVPPEMKDEKYWARRRKNNMAAKRSRDARRLKENQIAMRANFLEKENNAMTVELQKAQAIVESLKKRLAMYEAV